MTVSEIFKQIAGGLEAIGVSPTNSFDISYKDILELGSEALEELSLTAFEELLERISSYNIFLKSQKGSLEAQAVVIEAEVRRILHLETQKLEQRRGEVWLTKEEKEALVLEGNREVRNLHERALVLKGQILKIKDLPFAIDKKLDILKMRYRRKVNEQYRTQS